MGFVDLGSGWFEKGAVIIVLVTIWIKAFVTCLTIVTKLSVAIRDDIRAWRFRRMTRG